MKSAATIRSTSFASLIRRKSEQPIRAVVIDDFTARSTFGQHPDLIPHLANILLTDKLNGTLVNLASTCNYNWRNLLETIEKAKTPFRYPKRSWTLLKEMSKAQFLLTR